MPSLEDQYLPNEQIIQVQYKPDAKVLDYRGRWTSELSELLELPQWRVNDKGLEVFSTDQNLRVYVQFKQFGLVARDSTSSDVLDRFTAVIGFLFNGTRLQDPLHTLRIGVRARFYTPYASSFEILRDRYIKRYASLKDEALSEIGSGSQLLDIGVPVNFEDDIGRFNTLCGPMDRKQAFAQYFRDRDSDKLPEVGLYYDIDYFSLPNSDLRGEDIQQKVQSMSQAGWSRHLRLRKKIVGN